LKEKNCRIQGEVPVESPQATLEELKAKHSPIQ
jgi:hypothetical protein